MNPGDTCTPVYGLPYPTGASKPCNIGSTMCDFAEAVEVQLDALDATAARFASIPFAYASTLAQINYNNNIPGAFVPFFDTTLADTDNMIDLSLDPTIITIQTPGVYSFFYELDIHVGATGTSVSIQPTIRNTTGSQIGGNFSFQTLRFTGSTGMPPRTDGTRTANVSTTAEFLANVDIGYTYSFQINTAGTLGTISNIQTFRAGAIWLRDPL